MDLRSLNFHSIRAKIIGITITAILTTVVAIYFACFSTVQVENDRRAVELMNLITADTANTAEKYLESIQQSVEAAASMAGDSLSSVTLINNAAAGDYLKPKERTDEQNAALDAYLEKYCSRLQESFGSFADRTYGAVSYFYCINPEISDSVHGFYYAKSGKAGYTERAPIDASLLDAGDIEHSTWYFTPIERGRPSWIGPYRSSMQTDQQGEEIWLCSYVVPVYKAGMLIGVMGLDIPVDTLISQLRDVHVYESGYACLLNEEGLVIYHPEYETGSVAEKYETFIREKLLQNKSSGDDLIRYDDGGTERQLSYTTLSSGMKLVVTAPVAEISASWRQLFSFIVIITVLVLMLFAVLTFVIVSRIMQPLADVTEASQRLAAGDYEAELSYDKKDELGVLTRNFSRMRDKQKEAIEDLNRRAYTDALTGLPNMRHFFTLAENEKKRLNAEGREAVMLYMDLIGMKDYNTQFGFDEGDRLLIEIANMIEAHFGYSCVCRYGDDHFAAVTSADGVAGRIENLLDACSRANNGNSLPMAVGIYPDNIEDVNVSIACDRAKYAADANRGAYMSGFYRFDASMLDEIENTRFIIGRLDRALEEGWIKVYYQPIVSSESGRICDVEALSRWVDPEKGFLSPAEFIPVLENSRLIYKLDLYVLDRIIENIKRQEAAGHRTVPHSVNLSRSDFDSCDIVEEIRRRVDDAGVSRDMLTIEITESIVGSDFEFMKEQVERFRRLGFKVWMDDFGSGYSSLDVLQDIRFDLLKFDMRFLRRADESDESRVILRELTVMAGELGVDTLCEGVETATQAAFLKEIGCGRQQGYLYSKPVPYEELEAKIQFAGEMEEQRNE